MLLPCAFVIAASATAGPTGSWTIAAAGYPQVVILPGKGTMSKRTVTVTLPAGAVQGGSTWYRIHLHYRLALDPRTPPGHVYVEAATDGWPCAMIRFDVTRVHGKPHVVGTAMGLVDNGRLQTVGLVHEDTFENYLEYRGVRGGANTVTFTAERLGPARFQKLTIYGDTSIIRSTAGLPALKLTLSAPHQEAAGAPFAVPFRVSNTGGIRTSPGRVDLLLGDGLRELRAGVFPALRPGEAATGALRLVALRPGDYPITIAAQSSTASDAATFDLTVG